MIADIKQLNFIHHKLRKIALWLEKETGQTYTITSLYRAGDTGVHGQIPVRGMDLRCRNSKIGLQIQGYINSNWEYDPTRSYKKCAVLHGQGANLHLHLQVHAKTSRK